MPDRKQKEEILKLLIQKSILLDESDGEYWLSKLPSMPDEILDKVIAAVEKRNALAESYIKQALKDDEKGTTVEEMKELVSSTRNTAVSMEEKYQGGKAEEEIIKQMDGI